MQKTLSVIRIMVSVKTPKSNKCTQQGIFKKKKIQDSVNRPKHMENE